jgi:DNA-binding transcriptional LysR family regulator
LSTQIQQLETILGVQLLERSSRGVAVTSAGASFLDGARSTLAELDRAASAACDSASSYCPLAARDCLQLSDTEALPWIAAAAATNGCHPTAWRDDWLLSPRPSGAPLVIGATARTIDEWREYVAAGRGVSLCPASAETFHARPGITLVPGSDVPATPLCLAWRRDDTSPAVRRFITVARQTAGAVGVD